MTGLIALGFSAATLYPTTGLGLSLPVLLTLPSTIFGLWTGHPLVSLINSVGMLGLFEVIARMNVFDFHRQKLYRPSLTLKIGLLLGASAFLNFLAPQFIPFWLLISSAFGFMFAKPAEFWRAIDGIDRFLSRLGGKIS